MSPPVASRIRPSPKYLLVLASRVDCSTAGCCRYLSRGPGFRPGFRGDSLEFMMQHFCNIFEVLWLAYGQENHDGGARLSAIRDLLGSWDGLSKRAFKKFLDLQVPGVIPFRDWASSPLAGED